MKNLFINFTIAVMIFSGISVVHAGGPREIADENLLWYSWSEDDWRNLTPDQVDDFFPDPEAITTPDAWGINPLMYASAYSSVATINRFIENSADVTVRFTNGWTALGAAVIAGNNEVVSKLIKMGVDINQPFGEENWMPVVAGIARENAAAVASLLAAGADQNALRSFDFLMTVDIPQHNADATLSMTEKELNYLPVAIDLVNAWREVENKYAIVTGN